MAITRQAGLGMNLFPTVPIQDPAPPVAALNPFSTNTGNQTLSAGEAWLLPAGQWYVDPGTVSALQVYDPLLQIWLQLGTPTNDFKFITSDGVNVRLANQSGCAVGAVITNAGSGYTSAPTVTASSGSSQWRAIVGGSISTTVTITTAGAGYNYPPEVWIAPPPAGGVPATAIATLTSGVPSITVINQGAGYTTAPAIRLTPDSRESLAAAPGPTTTAYATTTLTGAGTITGLVCTNHGTPVTLAYNGTYPTLTITGGGGASGAATPLFNWAATSITVTSAGSGYTNNVPFVVQGFQGPLPTAAGSANPQLYTNLLTPRNSQIVGNTAAGTVLTATGSVVNDPGAILYPSYVSAGTVTNTGITVAGQAAPTTYGVCAVNLGGVTDTVGLYQY